MQIGLATTPLERAFISKQIEYGTLQDHWHTQLWGRAESDHCHPMLPLLPSYGSNLNSPYYQ